MKKPTIKELEIWSALVLTGSAFTMVGLISTPTPLRHRIVDIGDYLADRPAFPELSLPTSILTAPEPEPEPTGVKPPPKTPPLPFSEGPRDGLLPPLNDDPFQDINDSGSTTNRQKLEALPMLFTPGEFAALIEVECSGDYSLKGDGGKAYGPLQIWDNYLQDVNDRFGTNISHYELLGNVELSCLVANAYMHRYCPNGSFEERARIHNKGPSASKPGHIQYTKATPYWKKVIAASDTEVALK